MLYLGAAEMPLPLNAGLQMAGYIDRKEPGTGTHDPLFARAVYLSSGNQTSHVFLVSCDLVNIPLSWRARVKQDLRAALSLEPLHVVLASTHTHAAPDVTVNTNSGQTFAESVVRFIIDACCAAYHAREFCHYSAASTTPVDGIGSIRRFGTSVALPLTVQSFHTEADASAPPRLILVHFPCHPTILNADNRLYSAEYPGVAVKKLREKFGSKTIVCFFNGASGDISTRFTRRGQTFAEVERMGERIAAAAAALLCAPQQVISGDLDLWVDEKEVVLQRREMPTAEWLEGIRTQITSTPNTAGEGGRAERIRHTQAQALEVLSQWADLGCPDVLSATVTLLSFRGLLTYLVWPGEPFSGYAESLQSVSPKRLVLIGYAGEIGYLPDVTPSEDPSYEVLMSAYGREGGQALLDGSKALLSSYTEKEETR